MTPTYSVVVPVFNEEEVITESYNRLSSVMRGMNETYEIIFINDGSRDRTASIIAGFSKTDPNVVLVSFARNFGHMSAITAGMNYARGDAVMVIDADLQDPPELFPKMAELWKQGNDVVYGKRVERKGETFFKKLSAKMFYRLLKSLTAVDIPVDTGEFRLIDRKVCDAVNSLREKNRYIRGLVSWVGFTQVPVEYIREERFAGTTKYPFKKMVALAMNGIMSFSYKPLKLATSIGFFISICSFIYMLYILYLRIFTDSTVTGWASTIGMILFTQGIVLMLLGLMGEYVGRIHDEIKDRPAYIVQEVVGRDDTKDS